VRKISRVSGCPFEFISLRLLRLNTRGSGRPQSNTFVELANLRGRQAKRRDSFGTVAPNLNVVTVLTPATTVMEGFTNHLVESDYKRFPTGPQSQNRASAVLAELFSKNLQSTPTGDAVTRLRDTTDVRGCGKLKNTIHRFTPIAQILLLEGLCAVPFS